MKEDKLITVYLTSEDIPTNTKVLYSLKDFQLAIKEDISIIHTTQVVAISSEYYQKGYDIKVVSENKEISFSDILAYKNKGRNSFGREIRLGHNWERLILNGNINIKSDWEN